MAAPVERTVRYATNVDNLSDAWQFVMRYVDEVGPDPYIRVSPVWHYTHTLGDNDHPSRQFCVVVSGMEEEGEHLP